MAAIGLFVLVAGVAAGTAAVFIATIVVIIGVHQEERRKTIIRGLRPPTACAVVARWILGAHFYLIPEERPEQEEPPEEELPWFARSRPPKGPLGPGSNR
jgi:H+/Cl- antiporter ClcA